MGEWGGDERRRGREERGKGSENGKRGWGMTRWEEWRDRVNGGMRDKRRERRLLDGCGGLCRLGFEILLICTRMAEISDAEITEIDIKSWDTRIWLRDDCPKWSCFEDCYMQYFFFLLRGVKEDPTITDHSMMKLQKWSFWFCWKGWGMGS